MGTQKGDLVGFLRQLILEDPSCFSRSTEEVKLFKWESMGFAGTSIKCFND